MVKQNSIQSGSLLDWGLLMADYSEQYQAWSRDCQAANISLLPSKPYLYFNPKAATFRQQILISTKSTYIKGSIKLNLMDIDQLIRRDMKNFADIEVIPRVYRDLTSHLYEFFSQGKDGVKEKLNNSNVFCAFARLVQRIINWFKGLGWINHQEIKIKVMDDSLSIILKMNETVNQKIQLQQQIEGRTRYLASINDYKQSVNNHLIKVSLLIQNLKERYDLDYLLINNDISMVSDSGYLTLEYMPINREFLIEYEKKEIPRIKEYLNVLRYAHYLDYQELVSSLSDLSKIDDYLVKFIDKLQYRLVELT